MRPGSDQTEIVSILWELSKADALAGQTVQFHLSELLRRANGAADYTAVYDTQWVGAKGDGDFRSCYASIDSMTIESLE